MARAKFINPYDKGVTYEQFLKAIPKGKGVYAYLSGKLAKDQIRWILEEIEHYKKNK